MIVKGNLHVILVGLNKQHSVRENTFHTDIKTIYYQNKPLQEFFGEDNIIAEKLNQSSFVNYLIENLNNNLESVFIPK